MTQPEETPVSFIPSNFIEKGKILNGTFDIRNAIESIVLSLAIGIPVFHLPLSLTARIIILCMTALPAAAIKILVGPSAPPIIETSLLLFSFISVHPRKLEFD